MPATRKKKLTIRVDGRLIEQTKEYAALHNTSISQLVEAYLRDLSRREMEAHSPLVQELAGLIPPDADAENAYYQYLLEKYGD